MKLNILFFASLKERVGAKHLTVEMQEGTRVLDLRDRLAKEYPDAGQSLRVCLVALNRHFAVDEDLIPSESEVAFFPPVSGG
jgi:molybdopterin converting factor subunit 1